MDDGRQLVNTADDVWMEHGLSSVQPVPENEREPTELEAMTHILTDAFRQSYTSLAETGNEDDDFPPDLAVQGATAVINAVGRVMATPGPLPPEDTATELQPQLAGGEYLVHLGDFGRIYLTPVRDAGNVPLLKLSWVVEGADGKVYNVNDTMRGGAIDVT